MAVFLYRLNGGEVLGMSIDASTYSNIDITILGTLVNPSTPDGVDLAVKKIAISASTTVRNATGPEITAFAAAASSELTSTQRKDAIATLQTSPMMRKILRALVSTIVDELNILRADPTSVLAARTDAQAFNSIINKINSGIYD